LRYGTLSPERLVREARSHGINALALTDIHNSMGMPDFVAQCRNQGIHPIAGMEFREGDRHLYSGVAMNEEGFKELNDFMSHANLTGTPLPLTAPEFNHVFVVYPYETRPRKALHDYEFIGIRTGELRRLLTSEFRTDRSRLVALNPVTFLNDEGFELHKHLRAIHHNRLLSQVQPSQLARHNEQLQPVDELYRIHSEYPEIIRNTERIIQSCSIDFEQPHYKNKTTFTGSRYDDQLLLEKLAADGLHYRYGKNHKEASKRVKHELEIIHRMGFSSYFLITWDIVRYSMSRGFYHVGRGSGANSIVAYCLKITDVDPIELDLYFERFINPNRTNPPDFDIDYSWRERDEVLDYIFKRYGHQHTALLGATSTFKGKSIIRELGKVYGLPKTEIDALLDHPEDQTHRNTITDRIFRIGYLMADFPNLRSIHAGGVLISEKPITYYTALDLPPKGFQTTQWDMYVAEQLGFEKFDILSQRGIGHIKEAAEIIQYNRRIHVDVHAIQDFKKDERVLALMQSGRTTGCFYIESPAMRGLLQKLKCSNYTDLVAASSIIRPGVARSGMMREYIHRFHHPHDFEYLHPVMEEQLHETFGVMVYQEDVLKVCHHFAGLGLDEADVLRRAMSGKYRSKKEFQRIVDKFFRNCTEKGYPDALTREVWRQIESFAGYSFSKAHSASYAVESFQSLYLKSHFPIEFMVAVINNFGGFYRTWVYVNEARKMGAVIELPSVNESDYKTRLEGETVYLGFIHVQNLEHQMVARILNERQRSGVFGDLEDFIRRIQPGIEQLMLLIRINAFRFTRKSKKELLWQAHLLLNPESRKTIHPLPLFRLPSRNFQMPDLIQDPVEDAFDEIELLGFPVGMKWFDLLQTSFRGDIMAAEMHRHTGKKVKMVGQLVTIKYIKTRNREWMYFGSFHDEQGDFFDTVHFPQSIRNYPFRGSGLYLILGKVVEESGFASIEVEKLAKLPIVKDPRYA
jgi:DNA polymerase-3 subunit alpha